MNKNSLILFCKYLAIFAWLGILVQTDSYYSIYLLIGILATIITTKAREYRFHNTWLEYTFAGLLSLSITLANYSIFSNTIEPKIISITASVLSALIVFICGVIVFLSVLSFARTFYCKASKNKKDDTSPTKIFLISFLIFSLIDLIIFFTCCYPGSLTSDSIDEIGQILSGNYSNHHPFYFTILIRPFILAGINLFNDINIGVAFYNVFQILILSAVFSYSISTLYHIGIPKRTLFILTIILAILPYNMIYSFTIWKDVLFAASFLLFIVTQYRYFNNIQPYRKSKLLQSVIIFASGLTICLFRSNALIAIFVSTIIYFIIFKKKFIKLGIIFILIVIIAFVLKRPVLQAINVSQPDIIESLSIPSQQITKTIKYEKENLDIESLSLINDLVDTNMLIEAYHPNTQDPIKYIIRTVGNQNILRERPFDYIKLYLKLGIQYPKHYITAWINQTKGYWNGGYDYWIWSNEVQVNDYGIERKNNNFFNKMLNSYIDFFHMTPILQPLISIGLAAWILFLLLYRNIINKCTKNIFILIPFIATWSTLLIATPVFAEFRYIYFLFACIPFLTIITIVNKPTLLSNKRNKTNEKK